MDAGGKGRTVAEARGDEDARDEQGTHALEVCVGESAYGIRDAGGGFAAAVEGAGPGV